MLNGVFHFNLLDELITTFGGFFGCFSFLFKCLANNSGEPDPTPPLLLMYVASDLGLHCLPTSHKMEARLK